MRQEWLKGAARVPGRSALTWVVASSAFYALLVVLFGHLGPMVGAFSLIPTSQAGWFWGKRAGVLTGALVLALHTSISALYDRVSLQVFVASLPGIIVVLLTGVAAGWCGRLVQKVGDQTRTLRDSEERMQLLVRQIPVLLWTTDRSLAITWARGARPEGHRYDEAFGRSIPGMFHTADPAHPVIAAHLTALDGRAVAFECDLSGHRYQCRTEPFINAEGDAAGVIGVALDISDRMAADEALRASEERFRSSFEHSAVGMALMDLGGNWFRINPMLCQMVGYSEAELQGSAWQALCPTGEHLVLWSRTKELQKGGRRSCVLEHQLLHRCGHPVMVQTTISLVRDTSGRPFHFILQLQDITQRRRQEDQLRYLATHDHLTHLLNRRAFQEELEAGLAAARSGGSELALLFLDLDGFKYINDSMGHLAGDEFLRSLASLLRSEMEWCPGARLARVGGDEFAVILPGAGIEKGRQLGEQILHAVRRHVAVIRGQPVSTNVSIGVSGYPEHGEDGESLLAYADLAMFETKERGRNGVSVYEPERGRRSRSEQKLAWEARVRAALETDGFVFHAQPIFDLGTQEPTHYELLLRMIGDDGGLILPGAFLEVAERFGLIQEIDRWVIRHAIRLSAKLLSLGQPVRLCVNLSAKAFADEDLLPLMIQELARSGADPRLLVLEITETALVADTAQARAWIEFLRDLGVRFAVDDFGDGFWSFSHLRRLPVDYLKIDGSFIEGLAADPVNQHLVRSMVEMARGMGLKTIAEFVSDESSLQQVRQSGVDYGQGFHLGRPREVTQVWPGLLAPPC